MKETEKLLSKENNAESAMEEKKAAEENAEENAVEEVVVMHDEDGHEVCFYEESSVEYKGDRYALMVQVEDEDEDDECCCGHAHEHDDECDCGNATAFIAKVEKDADGNEVYVAPSDDCFEAVKKLFEALADSLDEEENR